MDDTSFPTEVARDAVLTCWAGMITDWRMFSDAKFRSEYLKKFAAMARQEGPGYWHVKA